MHAPYRQAVRLPWLVALVAAAAVSAPAQEPNGFLRDSFGLSDQELRALSKGEAVAKSLDPGDNHDVGAVAVIRVNTTPEFFVERFRDIVHFKSAEDVLQIGTFGSPPRMEDVAPIVWEPDDLRALRACRVGDCGVRLPADVIGRFRSEVDWTADDHDQQAARLANAVLVDLATAYLRGGDAALHAYRDRRQPVSPREEFLIVAAQSPSALDLVPEFRDYLVGFPRTALPGVDNFLYWSKEKIGFRSVLSLTHVAIYKPPAPGPVTVTIGTRQIYASHYFDASLGLTTILDRRSGPAGAALFDLMYLNRSRTDRLGGFWGRLARPIVRSRTRAAMEKYLALLKTRLEREFRSTHAPP